MLLYRYFNLTYGLEALQTGRWKIGRMAELNDPFDCRPHMVKVPPGTPDHSAFHQGFLEQLMAHLGVLCYSASINDPVIWSHYAESHKGLALGFEFSENPQSSKVKYANDRPILDFEELNKVKESVPSTALDKALEQGFKTKAPSWEYENEYRHFVRLDGCNLVGVHYFQNIPVKLLREVVLGARCAATMQDISRVLHPDKTAICSSPHPTPDYPSEVEIRQCKMSESSFELSFDTFTRLPVK